MIRKTQLLPLLIILIAICFFKPIVFPKFMFLNGAYLLIFVFVIMFLMNSGKYKFKDMPYRKLFVWYAFFIFCNVLSCWYFREQSFWLSLKCWAPFLMVFVMPSFKSWKLGNEKWEKVLLILFCMYMFCNYLQYIFIDTQLFYLMKEFERMEEEKRAVVFGEGILSLGALMCLNRFLLHKNKKYCLLYFIAVFLLFLHGFRMTILAFSIVSFLLIYKVVGISRKLILIIVSLLIISAGAFQLPIVQDKITEMENRNKSSSKLLDENYARGRSWYYFTNMHFKNNVERFLGSGQTVIYSKGTQNEKIIAYPSKYSKERCELVYYSYIWSIDWGLIGLSWDAGIPFTLVFVGILFAMFKQKLKVEHLYINCWSLMLLLIGITGAMSYVENIFIYYAVLLTIIERDISDNKLVIVK